MTFIATGGANFANTTLDGDASINTLVYNVGGVGIGSGSGSGSGGTRNSDSSGGGLESPSSSGSGQGRRSRGERPEEGSQRGS